MRSSGTQFYIVEGTIFNDEELNIAEELINNNITQAMFNKIIRHIADSANKSGQPLSNAQIQEFASEKCSITSQTQVDIKCLKITGSL